MRLTLRTMLAYLDDVLAPADAREIGEKIAESKEATQLVNRIREVIRRRRIGAPELAGPGSGPDPNLVGDYLENTLSPNQVVELERLCQNSDIHLAEVAACHKILTMITGQPIDVSEEARFRMYALGAAPAVGQETQPVVGEITEFPQMSEGIAAPQSEGFERGLPEYLTRRPWIENRGWIALVALIVIAWGTFTAMDPSLWSREKSVTQNGGANPGQPDGSPVANAVPEKEPSADKENRSPAAESPHEQVAEVPDTVLRPIPPIDPYDANLISGAGSQAVVSTLPRPAATHQQPEESIKHSTTSIPIPIVSHLDEGTLKYLQGDDMLMERIQQGLTWRLFNVAEPVLMGVDIASPPLFRHQLQFEQGLIIHLEPGARIQRLPREESSDLKIAVRRGRVILAQPLSANQPTVIDLEIDGRLWTLTLTEPGTRVGIEVVPTVPLGPPESPQRVSLGGGLVVAEGQASLHSGEKTQTLGKSENLSDWPLASEDWVTDATAGVPGWLSTDEAFVTPASKSLALLFRDEFLEDRTVTQSIAPVVKDRRGSIAELAVQTMSIIGHYRALVPGLNSEHAAVRLAAMQGLREGLGADPDLMTTIDEELQRVFHESVIPAVERLLWGYAPGQAHDPAVSRQLLDWMKNDEVAIREMAFYYVSSFTSLRYDYLPMGTPQQRRSAVLRWEEHVERNQGVMVAPPAE